MSRSLRIVLSLCDAGGISESTLSYYLAAMSLAQGEAL